MKPSRNPKESSSRGLTVLGGDSTVDYRLLPTLAEQDEPPDFAEDGFPQVDDLIGETIAQYRMRSIIGRGSMARVYEAEHLGLGRTSALKVMNPGLVARQPQVVERFWAEARAVAQLVHPHVVTVHNLGSDRGYHFIELEFVPGGVSLNELLVRGGPIPALQAATYVHQVSLALGAAHRSGLIHRDVKPSNVLLSADGQAKLADFGLVHRPGPGERALGGQKMAGTPNFMAPELFEGGEATARSDLYAVGVMFYYLLTGRLPFAADRLPQLIAQHRFAQPPDLRKMLEDVPDEMALAVTRLLSKKPEERHETADDLGEELVAIVAQLRLTDDLVQEALEGLTAHVQPSGPESYRVVMPLPSGRLHEVYIEGATGRKGERLLTVFSVCAPASPDHYEFVLFLNAELTHGSLSIRQVHGEAMFVMTRTFARRHVSAADIRAAVVEIARRGDWVEQQLTSTDIY